jgi:hypothetical protein
MAALRRWLREERMLFNFVIGTNPHHSWGPLEACGHRVSVSDVFVHPDAVNIFIDRIHTQTALIEELTTKDIRYGILFTEFLDPAGRLNWEEDAHGEDCAPGIREADFVWCLLKGSIEAVSRINPNTWYLPFGYVPSMPRIGRLARAERDIDLLVSGICSPRRQSILDSFRSRGYRCHCTNMAPSYIRDGLVARSNAQLSIHKLEHYRVISVTRICHSIINRVPTILETDDVDDEYARYCLCSSSEDLIGAADLFLREADIDEFADEMFKAFVRERDMVGTMEELVARSVR